MDFHTGGVVFASGGDDMTVKVWDLETRSTIATLEGHTDYVRRVVFHTELPWLVSCSDDMVRYAVFGTTR